MTETLLMTAAILIAGAEPASAPTGALLGWTSQDRVVARARELVEAGRLAEAEALLQSESRPEDQKAAQARRTATSESPMVLRAGKSAPRSGNSVPLRSIQMNCKRAKLVPMGKSWVRVIRTDMVRSIPVMGSPHG